MHPLAFTMDYYSGLPLIVSAGFAMYIASKALADALTGGDDTMPGRLALGQWLPIAILAVTAAITNHPQVAVGLIFSTAVACLSLAVGSVAFLGLSPVPGSMRRCWAMIVPAGLLAFLAGLRGSISLLSAGVLALEGICVVLLWNEGGAKVPATIAVARPGRGVVLRTVQFALALLVTGVFAWIALQGVDKTATQSEFASSGLLAATMIAPLLVLPIVGTGTDLTHRNQSAVAVTAQVGVALLNASALLPIVVSAAYLRQVADHIEPAPVLGHLQLGEFYTRQFAAHLIKPDFNFIPVPFPLAVWRVDVVALIALGLFLLPVAIGRWSISKVQGLALMGGYAVYLTLTVKIGLKRI